MAQAIKTLAFLWVLHLWSAALSAEPKSVSISYGEWAPYTSRYLPNNGLLAHLTEEAFALEGIKVEWRHMPWRRAKQQVERHGAQASIGWVKTPERNETLSYSDPMMQMVWRLFQHNDRPVSWNTKEDLNGTVIGVHSSSEYPFLRSLEKAGKVTIMPFHSYEFALRALLSGRINGFVAPHSVGMHAIRRNLSPDEGKQLSVGANKLDDLPIHLVVSKDLPEREEILTAFNRGIGKLKASGRYDVLMSSLADGMYDTPAPEEAKQLSALTPMTVRLTNGEWAPLFSENVAHYGLVSHITEASFKKANVSVEWQFMPWARALDVAARGSWDGSAAWLKIPEREEFFHYSDPILQTQRVFVQRADNIFLWDTLDDLKGKTIGVTLSSGYPLLKSAIESGAVKGLEFPDYTTSLRSLLSGRIDAVPLPRRVAEHLIRLRFRNQLSEFHFDPKIIETLPLHLVVSKEVENGPEIIDRFNKGLQLLKASGEFDAFLKDLDAGVYDRPEPDSETEDRQ